MEYEAERSAANSAFSSVHSSASLCAVNCKYVLLRGGFVRSTQLTDRRLTLELTRPAPVAHALDSLGADTIQATEVVPSVVDRSVVRSRARQVSHGVDMRYYFKYHALQSTLSIG